MLGSGAGAHTGGAHHNDGTTLVQAPRSLVDIGKSDVDSPGCVARLPLAALPHVKQGRTMLDQVEGLHALDRRAQATVCWLAAEEPSKTVNGRRGGLGIG